MLLASRSIKLWLESEIRSGNKDLLERVIARGTDLELQVNVSPRGGHPAHGKSNTFTDGVSDWFNFRIPKGAATEPHWKDFYLPYDLSVRVDSVGCTGWNWKKRVSEWVGFDFDNIVGHSSVGISDDKLDEIRLAVRSLPYVEVDFPKFGRQWVSLCHDRCDKEDWLWNVEVSRESSSSRRL